MASFKRPGLAKVVRTGLRLKRAYEAGAETADYPPLYLWIEPTNRCNLRCPMCPQSAGMKRPAGHMPPERLENIMDQAAGKAHLVSLHFAGEPLMHRDIAALVRTVSGRGIPVIMHTNGTLFNADIGRELIEAGLDQVVFSFDALPREEYPAKRPPADFETTLARIRGFLEVKKRLKSRWPLVTIKAIVFHGSEAGPDPARELRALFEGLPAERFSVEYAHTFAGSFAERVLREKPYSVQPRGEIHCCALPWYGFAIGWDGTAFACCNDLNGEYILGNTDSQGLMDIWNGGEMRTLRRSLAAKDLGGNALCAGCDAVHRYYPPSEVLRECARYTAKYILRRRLFPPKKENDEYRTPN